MRKTLGLDKRTKQYKLYKDNTVKTIKQANLEEFHQFSIEELFGKGISFAKGKPSNSEFIALLADKIRLKYNLGC